MKIRVSRIKTLIALVIFLTLLFPLVNFIYYHLKDYISSYGTSRRSKDRAAVASFIKSIDPNHIHIESFQDNPITYDDIKLLNGQELNSAVTIENQVELPSFSYDYSEYIFSSIIERSSSSSLKYYLSCFILCHYMLDSNPSPVISKVHKNSIEKWKRAYQSFHGLQYDARGIRQSSIKFYCRLRNRMNSSFHYIIEAEFVPNRLNSDTNANRRLDILRCPLLDSNDNPLENNHHNYTSTIPTEEIMELIQRNESLFVEILRGNETLLYYSVPWRTRQTGYLLSSEHKYSHSNPWEGLGAVHLDVPKTHICVPSTLKALDRRNLALWVEFVSHHLLIGTNHITLPTAWGMRSKEMKRMRSVFSSYIEEGRLSIISQNHDLTSQYAQLYVGGVQWDRQFIGLIQVNMCLYLAKGWADYVIILNTDELIIPSPASSPTSSTSSVSATSSSTSSSSCQYPSLTIGNMIQLAGKPLAHSLKSYIKVQDIQLEQLEQSWQGGPGWADAQAHPLCYLYLTSSIMLHSSRTITGTASLFHHGSMELDMEATQSYLGSRFSHGLEGNTTSRKNIHRVRYQRQVLPTQTIYHTGIVSPGACQLDWPWNGCQNPHGKDCSSNEESQEIFRFRKTSKGDVSFFNIDHKYSETVLLDDSKRIDPITEGLVYHYLIYDRFNLASPDSLQSTNRYSQCFFPDVWKDLQHRGLDVLLEFPNVVNGDGISDAVLRDMGLFKTWSGQVMNQTEFDRIASNPHSVYTDNETLSNRPGAMDIRSNEKDYLMKVSTEQDLLNVMEILERKRSVSKYSTDPSGSGSDEKGDSLPHYTALSPSSEEYLTRLRVPSEDSLVKLPNFAVDFSEFATGAMIERTAASWDLTLTLFLFCHHLLTLKEGLSEAGGLRVHSSMVEVWKRVVSRFELTTYQENGIRVEKLTCRIVNHYSSTTTGSNNSSSGGGGETGQGSYEVEGMWVPNNLTPDYNANRRYDILRCPMQRSRDSYLTHGHRHSNSFLLAEILRENKVILRFRIPWASRVSGYMLEPMIGNLDPWRGSPYYRDKETTWRQDKLYMTVPGLQSPPNVDSFPLYLEFMQHHLQLGVQHFFITAAFTAHSIHMKRLMKLLKSFIDHDQITITSHSGDGIDLLYSVAGMTFERDNMKNLQINLFTYYCKGLVDYVGIWDFDEFFIPKGNFTNIPDLIDRLDVTYQPGERGSFSKLSEYSHGDRDITQVYNEWMVPSNPSPSTSRRGYADRDGHPLCYIGLSSRVVLYAEEYNHEAVWIGNIFLNKEEMTNMSNGLAFEKSIRPTRTTFQGGMHTIGACLLPPQWNGCNPPVTSPSKGDNGSMLRSINDPMDPSTVIFCYGDGTMGMRLHSIVPVNETQSKVVNFNLNHRFDEKIFPSDAKFADPDEEAFILHVQFHRYWFISQHKDPVALKGNVYANRYFPRVYAALDQRHLVLPFELPTGSSLEASSSSSSSLLDGDDRREEHSDDDDIPWKEMDVHPTTVQDFNEGIGSYPRWIRVVEMNQTGSTPMILLLLGGMIERRLHSDALSLTAFFRMPSSINVTRMMDDEEDMECILSSIAMNEVRRDVKEPVSCQWNPLHHGSGSGLILLRCPIPIQANDSVAGHIPHHTLHAQILRNGSHFVDLNISWATRMTGLLSSHIHSRIDPWITTESNQTDTLFVTLPLISQSINKMSLSIIVENIQHHVTLGVSHVFLSFLCTRQGDWQHCNYLTKALQQYIVEGRVSVITLNGTALPDNTYQLMDEYQRIFWYYFTQGMSRHYMVLQQNDFMLSTALSHLSERNGSHRTPHSIIVKEISSAVHPLLPLHLKNSPWIGHRYMQYYDYNQKTLSSTTHRHQYQYILPAIPSDSQDPHLERCSVGLIYSQMQKVTHSPGDGCTGVIPLDPGRVIIHRYHPKSYDINLFWKRSSIDSLHFQSIHSDLNHSTSASPSKVSISKRWVSNIYSMDYFPCVYETLESRGVDLLFDVPDKFTLEELTPSDEKEGWMAFNMVHANRFDIRPLA